MPREMTAGLKLHGDGVWSIASVEAEIGVSKDRLRIWERRYGFPSPVRDRQGVRLYPAAQVARLRTIKRLIDAGHSPRKLLPLSDAALARMLGPQPDRWHDEAEIHNAVETLRRGELGAFESWLRNALLRAGLERFVLGTGRAAVDAVGAAWQAGAVAIWQEHFFSNLFSQLLGAAISDAATDAAGPTILLAAPTGEHHVLGLLMAHALFAARGTECISLGQDNPSREIVDAATACGATAVALSISVAYPPRRVRDVLSGIRDALPDDTNLWAGGSGVKSLARGRTLRDTEILPGLEDGLRALDRLRKG